MSAAAFFDMDGTLLSVNSGAAYIRLMWRRRLIGPRELARGMVWVAQYKAGVIDTERVVALALASVKGQPEQEMIDRCRVWFRDELRATIMRGGRAAVERHRKAGHPLVILTSATRYAAEPLCEELGIPDLLCTRLEVEGGMFTGRYVPPLCFGDGKIAQAKAYAEERGISLAESYFYTDSINDLPMLERVGNPRVINPDLRLSWLARRRGWPVEDWR
jgi:HAD superfamily hydrolase (TIGR01490 family)